MLLADWQDAVDNLEEDDSCAWWSGQTSSVHPSVAHVNHVLELTIWNFSLISEDISLLVLKIERLEELINDSSVLVGDWVEVVAIEDETEG